LPGNGSLHPDFNHKPGKPPHWDWTAPYGNGWEYCPETGKWKPKRTNKPNRPQPLFPPGTLEQFVDGAAIGAGVWGAAEIIEAILAGLGFAM
jgi:hypothetical protein